MSKKASDIRISRISAFNAELHCTIDYEFILSSSIRSLAFVRLSILVEPPLFINQLNSSMQWNFISVNAHSIWDILCLFFFFCIRFVNGTFCFIFTVLFKVNKQREPCIQRLGRICVVNSIRKQTFVAVSKEFKFGLF